MRSHLRHRDDDPRVLACKLAVRAAGGQKQLALKLNIKPQAVYGWLIKKGVPPERCLAVSELSGFSVHQLRPDIFGPDRRAG